jgi:hypothetical protein
MYKKHYHKGRDDNNNEEIVDYVPEPESESIEEEGSSKVNSINDDDLDHIEFKIEEPLKISMEFIRCDDNNLRLFDIHFDILSKIDEFENISKIDSFYKDQKESIEIKLTSQNRLKKSTYKENNLFVNFSEFTLDNMVLLRLHKGYFYHIIKLLIIDSYIKNDSNINEQIEIICNTNPFLIADIESDSRILVDDRKKKIGELLKRYINDHILPYTNLIIDFNNNEILNLTNYISNDLQINEVEFISEFNKIFLTNNKDKQTFFKNINMNSKLYIDNDKLDKKTLKKLEIHIKHNEYEETRKCLLYIFLKLNSEELKDLNKQKKHNFYVLVSLFLFILVYTETIMYIGLIDTFIKKTLFEYDVSEMFFIDFIEKITKVSTRLLNSNYDIKRINNLFNEKTNEEKIFKNNIIKFFNDNKLDTLIDNHNVNIVDLKSKIDKYNTSYKNKKTIARIVY